MPFSTGNFDRLLDKATSSILLEPDWDATLQLCDAIRAGEVTPKYAANAITKKVLDKNSNVCLFALSVAESCMKNCGSKFHEELLTLQFLENLHDLAKKSELPIRQKICSLVQAWDRAFRNESRFLCVKTTYEMMKREDFTFPESMRESDYMFVSDCAPEWKEDKQCYRCRTEFSTFTRQHHCRHCGQSFCAKCSSKSSTIAKFGIEKEVRVCDACYDILNKTSTSKMSSSSSDGAKSSNGIKDDDELMAAYLSSSLAKEAQTPAPVSREDKLKEEEELQLALAISQSEAEVTTKPSKKNVSSDRAPSPKVKTYASSGKVAEDPKSDELAKYMDRSYWEKKRQEQQRILDSESVAVVSAPARVDAVPKMESLTSVGTANSFQALFGNEVNSEDTNEKCNLIQRKLDVFLNRMRSNMTRGRNITADSAVQSAFQELSSLQPVLAKMIAANEMKRNHFESQQDQLSLMKDTRETLDSMRDDHQEKLRQEKMEKERQMQMQRQQKMEALRGLKQQFLIHRMQQLENERQNQANMQEMQMQQHLQYNPATVPPGQFPPQYGMAPQYSSMGGTTMQSAPQMYPGQPVSGAFNMQAMMSAVPQQSVKQAPGFMPGGMPQYPSGGQSMAPNPQQQYVPGAADYSSMPNAQQQMMQPGQLQMGVPAHANVAMAATGNPADVSAAQMAGVNQGYLQQPPPNMGNAQQGQFMNPQQQIPPQPNVQNAGGNFGAVRATESPLIDFG